MLAASVGTEGALTALAEIAGLPVHAVVAISPSSVIWQALAEGRPPEKPSWTLTGRPLPYVQLRGERLLPQIIKNAILDKLTHHPRPSAMHLLEAYAPGLRDLAAAEQAAIRVERIDAPILFLTGADDQMWPAAAMVESMLARRRSAGKLSDSQVNFQGAGHIIRPPYAPTTITWTEELYSGGTPQGCAAASAGGWRETMVFLEKQLA